MRRDVTSLRNIGIMASIDAGNATCRESIFELIIGARAIDGDSSVGPLHPSHLSPASSGTWTPRSGPFADEPTTLTFVARNRRAVDGALVVLDGARGTAETSDPVLRDLCARRVPCVVFIDDVVDLADMQAMVAALEADLGTTALPVYVPWQDGRGAHVIDVLEQRLVVKPNSTGVRILRPVPAEAEDAVRRLRRRIIDVCAERDESIREAQASGLDVSADELARALRKAALASDSRVLVVTCGSLRARRGVAPLLDALVTYLPSPAERPPVVGVDPRRSLPVERFAREADALGAMVFAATDVPQLGRLAWLRIYSGRMDVSATVLLLPRDEKTRIERIFQPDARGLLEVNTAGPGDIVCVSGVTDALAGDSLSCVRAPIVLDETDALPRPSLRPTTYTESVAPRHLRTVWSVARSLQSVPVSNTGLRRTRT